MGVFSSFASVCDLCMRTFCFYFQSSSQSHRMRLLCHIIIHNLMEFWQWIGVFEAIENEPEEKDVVFAWITIFIKYYMNCFRHPTNRPANAIKWYDRGNENGWEAEMRLESRRETEEEKKKTETQVKCTWHPRIVHGLLVKIHLSNYGEM